MKNLIFINLIFILYLFAGQEARGQVQPDTGTLQQYFYPNGKLSSEGILRDGKPDRYWRTFHENGKLKSEGNRINFELDSTWKFYDEEEKLILEIQYKKGKKHGLKKTYAEGEMLWEIFVNDIKQGPATYFYPDGKVKKVVPFVSGQENGFSREFDQDGNVITMIEYKKGFILSREYVNRRDKNGEPAGKWVTFWENGSLHTEGTYRNGKKNGYFREYTPDGKLFKIFKWVEGELQEDAEEIARIDERADYYQSGRIRIQAQYRNNVLDGIWREYSEEGKLEKGLFYKRGVIIGKGITDEAGLRQGSWTEYYDDGQLRAEGKYRDGKRIGQWKYYYKSGRLEEEGGYDNQGRPDGDWKWYYEDGQLLKEMSFSNGKEDGMMTEYTEDGKIIAKGEYIDGLEQGAWSYAYGDYREEGTYQNGQRDGLWTGYYANGNKTFEGKYVEDLPDGRHYYYWENGNKKDEGVYMMGRREGDWIKYNDDGTPFLIITYKNGSEKRYDGIKILPEINEGDD